MNSSWLALLNVGRNRRRTTLLLLIMTTGTAGLIVNRGLVTYIFDGLRDVAIYGRYGHLQLYKTGYKLNHQRSPFEYWFTDKEYAALEPVLRGFSHVRSATPEATLPVYLTWGARNAAGLATGIPPSDLKMLTGTRLVSGREEIRDTGSYAEAIVGRGLAEKLQLRAGDIMTISAADGSHGYNALDVKVNGIFEEGFRDYDDWTLKLPLSALQRLSGQSGVERIIVVLDDTAKTEQIQAEIETSLRKNGFAIETASWRDLAEFYRQVVALFGKELDVIQWIVQILVFFAVVTGLAMVYAERQNEMATLLAMGMTRSHLAALFAQESAWFGVLAALLGVLIGVIAAIVVSCIGINMPPPPGSTRGFVARVNISALEVSFYGFLTFVVACSAAVIPAFWIWRLDIAAALRGNKN